jgi:endo-1,4-beta-xylanase
MQLYSAASKKGLYFGTAISFEPLQQDDMRHLVRQHVNSLTPENAMKWEVIHPEKGSFDWKQMDEVR